MAFPIHHVMQTEEEVEPLDQIDQAASDRILELFATSYPELTRAQVLMLERSNETQTNVFYCARLQVVLDWKEITLMWNFHTVLYITTLRCMWCWKYRVFRTMMRTKKKMKTTPADMYSSKFMWIMRSDAKTRKYLQKLWFQHKQGYSPNVPSVVTESWIFTTYQEAVEKISCLQFCHILKALNDTTYQYISDRVVLPVNLQLEPLLHSLGITITLQGSVSDEDLESIGLSDLFGVPFNEESFKESKIVLYRESNNHFEYRGVTTDWSKKHFSDKAAGKTLICVCKERGHKFTFEPRRILTDKDDMEKAECMTILGSAIVSYLHAPRPDTRQDFVNVNCRLDTKFLVNRRRIISDMHNVPLQSYENPEEHAEDYSYDDEAAFYDA
ncbi:uncharacterized protein LOC110859920 [Folsomia candida]|uniref:Uncharacterized protein n=1 Tax=Folsomia candida TaxID=158441 RepID=A0A226D9N5_FOLCA|nr:uncharacterized protein LOC110859920 [Folsomia candida]OXA41863.1 hypothetical protein Fcan01_23386 [Folsomia candida]